MAARPLLEVTNLKTRFWTDDGEELWARGLGGRMVQVALARDEQRVLSVADDGAGRSL